MLKLLFHSAEEEAFGKAIFTKTGKIISKHNRDPNTMGLMDQNKYSTLVYNTIIMNLYNKFL